MKILGEQIISGSWKTRFQPNIVDDIPGEIRKLSSLPAGWDLGAGEPIAEMVIAKAISVAMHYGAGTFSGVHPMTEGGVKIVLSDGRGTFLDINVNKDLSLDLIKERGVGMDYEEVFEKENVSEDELQYEIDLLNNIVSSQPCNLSGPSTYSNITPKRSGSTLTASQNTAMGSPYLIFIALNSHQVQFANILGSTTSVQLNYPTFSGYSS